MFLETLTTTLGESDALGGMIAAIASILVAFMFVLFLVGIGIYIYMSFAFMNIGKKAKLKMPGLAWIPAVGPMIIAFQSSKMHWWPWLLLTGILVSLIPVVGWFIGGVALTVFSVYTYIWTWKMFEKVNRPGWWALIPLVSLLSFIPVVGFVFGLAGSVGYFVVIGIAAWGKGKSAPQKRPQASPKKKK